MTPNYLPVSSTRLQSGAAYHRPDHIFMDLISLEDQAMAVMTDLRKITAVTINREATLEIASTRMKQRGVRLLLVVDAGDAIVGLITSTDLAGEKPLQHLQKNGGTWSEILVKDIMTPQDKLEVLCMADVLRAKVGNVVATLKKAGRQHALVVDHIQPGTPQVVRGIFSASQIARQLNTEIQTTEVAQTFAEIEVLLMSA